MKRAGRATITGVEAKSPSRSSSGRPRAALWKRLVVAEFGPSGGGVVGLAQTENCREWGDELQHFCCSARIWREWRAILVLWMLRKFRKYWRASEAHSQKGVRPVVLEWIYQVAAFICVIGSLSNLRAVIKCSSTLCFCRKLLFLFKVKLKLGPFYNIFSFWYTAYPIGFHTD